MKNKRTIIIIILIIIFLLITYFFCYKKIKYGNNIYNKTSKQIEEYILNINSYEAILEVEVISNKNTIKYKAKQSYSGPKQCYQEILEPENIKGLKIIFSDDKLKLENTKLNLSKIYDNYQYITQNYMWLYDFVEDYKNGGNYEETNNNIIMTTNSKNNNIYQIYKKLYINKNNCSPEKLEIININKNIYIYIRYNEMKINSIKKEDVLAFKLKNELI